MIHRSLVTNQLDRPDHRRRHRHGLGVLLHDSRRQLSRPQSRRTALSHQGFWPYQVYSQHDTLYISYTSPWYAQLKLTNARCRRAQTGDPCKQDTGSYDLALYSTVQGLVTLLSSGVGLQHIHESRQALQIEISISVVPVGEETFSESGRSSDQ